MLRLPDAALEPRMIFQACITRRPGLSGATKAALAAIVCKAANPVFGLLL